METSSLQNALKDIQSKLRELDKTSLIVGVQAESGTNFHDQEVSSSPEMLKIAYVHEFGYDITVTPKMRAYLHTLGIHLKKTTKVIHIPERSFIRKGHVEGKPNFDQLLKVIIHQLFRDKNLTVDDCLESLGKQALSATFDSLGVDAKPITEVTKRNRKASASSTPLVDTGSLQNHITYRIKKGGK